MVHLYIDPGTGSMLFTILIGVIGAAIYFFRNLFMKLKFFISGGKVEKSADKIPFVIYSDHKRYWNVFEPICDEFERRGVDVVFYTSSEDDPALSKNYEHVKCEFIGEGNKAFAKLNMLNASVLLATTPGLDVYQWKRSKDVDYYIHIPHSPSDILTYRMFGLDYYDAILVNGAFQGDQVRQLEAIRNIKKKEIEIVGLPYMDRMIQQLKAAKPLEKNDEITVLVAPSWGKSAILGKYGEKFLDAILKTGYHIIVRPHPQSYTSEKELIDNLQKKYPNSDQLEWNRDNDNFEVLRKSDIMISDFSGVIFDFVLVFDKPIIYADTSFDSSPYDAWWVDGPIWSFEVLPRLGNQLKETDFDRMKELIDDGISSSYFTEERQKVREECWQYQGLGAQKTVDYMLHKYEQLSNTEENK